MGNIRACHCAVAGVSGGASGGSLSPLPTVHSRSRVHNPASWSQFQFPSPNSHSLVLIFSFWFPSRLLGPYPGSVVSARGGSITGCRRARRAFRELEWAAKGAGGGDKRHLLAGKTERHSLLTRRCPAPQSARALEQLGAGHLASRDTLAFAQLRAVPCTRHAAAPSAAPGLCPALPRRPLQADHTLSPPQPSTPVSLTLHRLLRRPASSHPLSPRASELAPSSNFPRWSPPAWEPLDSGWKVPGPSFHKPNLST